MADWNNPTITSNYSTGVLQVLKDRDFDAISLCLNDPTNMSDGMLKWHRGSLKLQERSSGSWVDRLLAVVGGGTGAATASGARTNLGLGTMAIQNSNAVAITGGTLGGDGTLITSLQAENIQSGGVLPNLNGASLTALNGTAISTGTVAAARLGSGVDAAKFLRGDSTWQEVGVVESVQYMTVTIPSGSGARTENFTLGVTLTDYTNAVITHVSADSAGLLHARWQITSNSNLRYTKSDDGQDVSFIVFHLYIVEFR